LTRCSAHSRHGPKREPDPHRCGLRQLGKAGRDGTCLGWSASDSNIDKLTPTGGTSSAGAFKVTLDALVPGTKKHKKTNGLTAFFFPSINASRLAWIRQH